MRVVAEVRSVSMKRRERGSSIAETAASLVLLLPLLITIMFVVMEASRAYLIQQGLSQGAREAARNLAIAYGQNNNINNNRPLQDALVYSNIHINQIINSSSQFTDAQFDPTGIPPYVTVTVNYTSGQNGCPVFPTLGPLNLGNSFHLSATSTYRIE